MDNEDLARESFGLYAQMNNIVGSMAEINIRRTTTNLRDDLLRMECELGNKNYVPVFSGSKAEGLRFQSSDDDWMLIDRDVKVIPPHTYTTIYDSNTIPILMENEMTKPGFTLLRVVSESSKPAVSMSTVTIPDLNGWFVSCKLWRELLVNATKHGGCHQQFLHGPCTSSCCGGHEYDIAHCMRSYTWPYNAQDCVARLHQSGWPSHDKILSIVEDGVLFVPIGAKQSIFENLEWRMSFSLAEKKLIYAMNHTQFLCYALLKIFLKEAIDVNPNVKGLLCSYFLKTSLFWEITSATSNEWNPSTLLSCFWNCFCRLLKWISCSYCPNFFIPQNNMFEGKIEGTNRNNLLQHLSTLYYEGYGCLQRCHSLTLFNQCGVMMHIPIPYFYLAEPTPCHSCTTRMIIMECYSQMIDGYSIQTPIPASKKFLLPYQLANHTTYNTQERFLLRQRLHKTSTEMCMTESTHSLATRCNRSHYRNLTQRLHVMQRFAFDSVSHILYQAMLCYNNGKYHQVLQLVQLYKQKISAPDTMYFQCAAIEAKKCNALGGENLPTETLVRKHLVFDIEIEHDEFIPDLYIEIHTLRPDWSVFGVQIPPNTCALFLQYLCQRRLGCQPEADKTIHEISHFLQNDKELLLGNYNFAISWQILGICQQMNGDDWGACPSYLTALQKTTKLKVASCIRLATILVKYIKQY